MNTYNVYGSKRYITYDNVYFTIEANSEEEALQLVKESPDEYEVDYKCVATSALEYTDKEEWEVYKRA